MLKGTVTHITDWSLSQMPHFILLTVAMSAEATKANH